MKFVLCLLLVLFVTACDDIRNTIAIPESIETPTEHSDGWLFTGMSIGPIEIQKGRTRYINADDLFEFRNPFSISATSDNTDIAVVNIQGNVFLISAVDIGETEVTFTGKNRDGQLDTGIRVTVIAVE